MNGRLLPARAFLLIVRTLNSEKLQNFCGGYEQVIGSHKLNKIVESKLLSLVVKVNIFHFKFHFIFFIFYSVWGIKPDLTREGGSIPVIVTLQDATKADVMLLPMGQSDDGAHAQNEKLSENNYINGVR